MSSSFKKKVVPYVIPGLTEYEEIKGITYQIRNTRQEETFRKFKDPNSLQSLLCDIVSEDDLLRLFFFLKPHISLQPVEEYPLVFEYPLFLDIDEQFWGKISDESTKKVIEDMKERREDILKSFKEISSKTMWKFFTVAVSDPQVGPRLRRRRGHIKEQEVQELISGLVHRRRNLFDGFVKDSIDVFGSMYYVNEYYVPIIETYERMKEAKDNLDLLSQSLVVMDIAQALRDSLSKLISQRIFRLKISSLCMECKLRKSLEPYRMIQRYPLEPTLDAHCDKCGGRSVYHQIEMEAPYSFGPLFKENTLQELIIGYTLAKSEKIKKLYIHKKISMMKKQGPLPGLQLNIFAITADEKIIIAEVTTSRNLNKVMKDVDKKLDALKDFQYDQLVFIAPTELKDYLDYKKKVRIFGSGHLPKIVSHMGYLVESM